jgi:hypothetical protein
VHELYTESILDVWIDGVKFGVLLML